MSMKLLLLPLITLAACSGRSDRTTDEPPAAPSPAPAASAPATPQPSPVAAGTPDPAADHRSRLLARIEKLSESECDALVLEFQIIPRDEILDPVNKQKRELKRYVQRVASAEDLGAIERAIKAREPRPPQPAP